MIRITSKQNNFRRCGVSHPAVATGYEDDFFTDEQLNTLKNEPMLMVESVSLPLELDPGKPESDTVDADKSDKPKERKLKAVATDVTE